MRLPYLPGQETKLQWAPRENYNKAQWQKLEILTDLAYAASFGFLHTRMPTPGESLDPQLAEQRAKKVEEAWKWEAYRQSKEKEIKGLPVSEFPQQTKFYLFERLKNLSPPVKRRFTPARS